MPVEEVGTDRHRLDMWTPASPVAYNKFADGYPWDFTGFKKTDGYVSVPLDGVWLRAPYLHNGSVPTLRGTVRPPETRRARFYRGYNVFDPSRVGFISEGDAAARGSLYDTTSARKQQRRSPLRRRAHAGAEEGADRVSEDSVDGLTDQG